MKRTLRKLTDWTHWPFFTFYFPLFFVWGWYCLKSRAAWFFSASNPTISFGGFEGESKSEIYSQISPHLFPTTMLVQPGMVEKELLQQVGQTFVFPFVVKPDVGMKGILFRKIENEAQLIKYHRHMPAPYLVQAFVDMPNEVSVFYIRQPHRAVGEITALIQKNLLEVTGDGVSTVGQLLQQKGDSDAWLPAIQRQQGRQLQTVLPVGEKLCLSNVGNRMNGATFINLSHLINGELLAVFDAISHQGQFCYGRYDIKCASIESMTKGKDFLILEFNGAGSIPNHIYTSDYNLWSAYAEILKHWEALYRISKANHRNGVKYWSFIKGIRFLQASKKHFDKLKKLTGNWC
ncbi:MAG: hypothetical protein ACO1NX_04650 [Chitinophagaceae bacterium]